MVKLLLARDNVEADSKDNDGWTPLSRAAWGGHGAVVKVMWQALGYKPVIDSNECN